MKSISADNSLKPFEKMQQMVSHLSHLFEQKSNKKFSQVLFCDGDRISGGKPNLGLLVLTLFETLLLFFILDGFEDDYLKIFEVV